MKVNVPLEVIHNCVHTDVFKRISPNKILPTVNKHLNTIKEEFCFLFVGHWLQGSIGEDRKNVGLLVKLFCEAFKDTPTSKRPALILKTSGAGFSILDQEEVLGKIRQIRNVFGANCPNVYLLHGELTEPEMNSLYNHPKVKTHISLTKGEGFGRPLLEATQSEKPLIASGWSGHMDFMNPEDALLIGGELRNVEASAVWQGVILPEAQWFNADPNMTINAMKYIMTHHVAFKTKSEILARKNAAKFSYEAIQQRTIELLDKHVPQFVLPTPFNLPKLNLPQLKKITG
jgi:glycosyltransferase involved in cell wall biosynthesis